MGRHRQIVPSGRTILVVDDRPETLETVRALLRREGHRVLVAESGAKALALLTAEPVHLLIVDYLMPVMSGELLIRAIRERHPFVQIVLQSGYAGAAPPREMLQRLAIQGYHHKSDGAERLLVWVDVALKAHDQLATARAAERIKAELLANTSHELRTPLNVILGYLGLVVDGAFGDVPPAAREALGKVAGNATALLELVDEFLDLAQIEAGALEVRCARVELSALLEEIVGGHAMLAGARPVTVTLDVDPDLPAVRADPAKLRLVLQQLVANALKFTAAGTVAVAATPTADGRVAVAVRDTGPGIPVESQDAVFDPFFQVAPHDGTRRGLGLGLALARRFARMMDGDLTVESAPGAGSTFTLVLPTPVGAGLPDLAVRSAA